MDDDGRGKRRSGDPQTHETESSGRLPFSQHKAENSYKFQCYCLPQISIPVVEVHTLVAAVMVPQNTHVRRSAPAAGA